jgi:hypothetical protein
VDGRHRGPAGPGLSYEYGAEIILGFGVSRTGNADDRPKTETAHTKIEVQRRFNVLQVAWTGQMMVTHGGEEVESKDKRAALNELIDAAKSGLERVVEEVANSN